MHIKNSWVLEIACQNGHLSMSLHESAQASPFKAISTVLIDFSKIDYFNNEIIAIINRASRMGMLDEDSIIEFKKNARLLYDLLLSRQIKNQLSSIGDNAGINLLLSLDERLISIPWELLFDGENFLCLKFNLGRSIRTQIFSAQPQYRSIPAKPKILILANPTGDLKSAYQEGLYIKNHLTKKGKLSVDFKAQDIDSNYVRKNLRDYDIIHFAGHCEYSDKYPEESGWVLSDGRINARDFLILGENASLPSIIFVNACQSARTIDNILDFQAQNNIYGLAQAFLFAGARHYLGSFWRIDDSLGSKFAEVFYNQIINGQSIGQAVRSARLSLFKQYGISAIAWAGYILYGDPGFILPPSNAAQPERAGLIKKDGKSISQFINRKKVIYPSLILAITILGFSFVKILPTFNPTTQFRFSQAEHLYKEGKNSIVFDLLNRIIEQEPSYLPAWKLRGDVHFRLGRFTNALSDYFDYARFSERKRNYKHLASAYIKIAWTYHMWGNYPKSNEFYQKALNLSRKHQDKLNEADAMARLAVWYIDKRDNETAFSLLMKSSEINRQRSRNPEHKFNLACDYFNIAFLYIEKEDYPTAKKFFKKSKDMFESLGAIPELSDYYFDMGEIALFEKNYNSALEFYHKGLALDRALNHRFNLSSSYWMLGEFYWEIDKFPEAENYFKQAIFICREINNFPVLAGVYYDLGLMYKEMGKSNKAKDYLSQALKLYKDIDTPDYQEVQQEYLALVE